MSRGRYPTRAAPRANTVYPFINPWHGLLPSSDARVLIRVRQLGIPYWYRYFGVNNPTIKLLLPDWAPEFTFPDYKVVIVVDGAFWGSIPSVLAKNIIAETILKREGWGFYHWHEYDIVSDLDRLFHSVPEFRNLHTRGGELTNPHAASLPNIMEQFRLMQSRRRRYIAANPEVRRRIYRVRNRTNRIATRRRTRDLSRRRRTRNR